MRMFKDEHEAYVEKDQVDLMLKSGWSKDKPVPDEESEEKSETAGNSDSELDGEESTDSQSAHKKPVIKKVSKKI